VLILIGIWRKFFAISRNTGLKLIEEIAALEVHVAADRLKLRQIPLKLCAK